jgi:hypothetical protein
MIGLQIFYRATSPGVAHKFSHKILMVNFSKVDPHIYWSRLNMVEIDMVESIYIPILHLVLD